VNEGQTVDQGPHESEPQSVIQGQNADQGPNEGDRQIVSQGPNEPLELHLGGFDRHGTTRARVGRRWVEIEHGIPGEVVRARVTGGKRPMGKILEILEPAEDRIEPPCPYFREWQCGGCQWQQISYEGQVRRKREGVDSAMEEAGVPVRVSEVYTAEPWRYRTTAGVALGRHAGFRRHGSLAIVPMRDCPISHPLIGALCATLNEAIEARTITDFHGRVRLDIRLLRAGGDEGLQILVRPDNERRPPREEVEPLLELLRAQPAVHGLALTSITGEIEPVIGGIFGTTEIAGRKVQLATGSFFQTNVELLERLIDRLQHEAGNVRGLRMADVYGGVGLFGLLLSGDARDVAIIESDPLAIAAGERTAAEWGVTNVRFLSGRAEDVLEGDGPYDLVILDPPRTGLSEQAAGILIGHEPRTILYVSCLAESLARDLAALIGAGYTVETLELFDFYPQTYHVELLAVLRR
jgi:23S rRNA (uracil1939-C5)-methyltransferase